MRHCVISAQAVVLDGAAQDGMGGHSKKACLQTAAIETRCRSAPLQPLGGSVERAEAYPEPRTSEVPAVPRLTSGSINKRQYSSSNTATTAMTDSMLDSVIPAQAVVIGGAAQDRMGGHSEIGACSQTAVIKTRCRSAPLQPLGGSIERAKVSPEPRTSEETTAPKSTPDRINKRQHSSSNTATAVATNSIHDSVILAQAVVIDGAARGRLGGHSEVEACSQTAVIEGDATLTADQKSASKRAGKRRSSPPEIGKKTTTNNRRTEKQRSDTHDNNNNHSCDNLYTTNKNNSTTSEHPANSEEQHRSKVGSMMTTKSYRAVKAYRRNKVSGPGSIPAVDQLDSSIDDPVGW